MQLELPEAGSGIMTELSQRKAVNILVAKVLGVTALSSIALALLLYVALENKHTRKFVPKSLWRPLGKLCFFPLLLPNYARRRIMGKPFWTDVGAGILCGCTPLVFAGHVDAHGERAAR